MEEKFKIATSAYEGPLETLLNLIEERKMSVSAISLSEVCDAYLAYVEKLPELPLGETAQFILVASTLLLIKSRALLPTLELSESERESVEELERRLARYAVVRSAARLLRKEWGKAPLIFPRRAPQRSPIFTPAESSAATIAASALRLLSILPKPETMMRAAVAPVLALEEIVERLRKRLSGAFRARFSELTQEKDRNEVIVYFLAVLELVRGGSISATQERVFSEILVETEALAGAPRYGA